MNMQRRSELRSQALHHEVAKKLRRNSKLWDIPRQNLDNWIKRKSEPHPALVEWKEILAQCTREEILSILESNSEDAARLRSSSPFGGILSDKERKTIFDSFKFKSSNRK